MDTVKNENTQEVQSFLRLNLNERAEFQELVDLAAKVCNVPVSIVSLLDHDFNHLVVRHGVEAEVMPANTSFCQYVIANDDLLIISDTTQDQRFIDNPLVCTGPMVRFYAGAPLKLSNGKRIGSLCVFDFSPRKLDDIQKSVLSVLSRQAVTAMEKELAYLELKEMIDKVEEKNQSLLKIAGLQAHQIRQPLTSIMGLAELINNRIHEVDQQWLDMFAEATSNFDKIIQHIVSETFSEKDVKAIRFYKMIEEIDECGIILLDRNGYIENWNIGAKKIKGYSYKEVIGQHFSIFYSENDKATGRPQKLLEEAAMNGVARDEGWRVRKDGKFFWASLVITAIHDQHKQVIGFTKLTRDLTAVMDIKESLKASDNLYNHIMSQTARTSRVGGWQLDLSKNELFWTTVTKDIHGVEPDFVPDLDNAINFYKPGEDREKISRLVNAAINEGKPWDTELVIINRQGKEIRVRATGESNFKDGVCTKVYGTFQEICKQKR